jgi:hypothetical protein
MADVILTNDEVVQALKNLGFTSGFAVLGPNIELWENPEPQPTQAELRAALKG